MQRLDISTPQFKAAPHEPLSKALRAGPFALVKLPLLGPVKAALTHDAARQVLKDTGRFAVNARNAGHRRAFGLPFLPKSMRLLSENILSVDDPDHLRLRRLADAPFRRAAIETRRERLADLVDETLDRVAAQYSSEVDLSALVFRPLPLMVISDLLGLSSGARTRLEQIMNGFSGATSTWGILRAMTGLGGVVSQLREEIEAARRDPRPGLLSELIHADDESGQLSEDELVSLVLVLFVAGHDTTTNLLSTGLFTLRSEPDAWEAATSLDADGWRIAIDELMRYAMPVHMTKPRFVISDTEICGESLKRGDKVIALLGSANLDPDVFDAPQTFDITRRPNRHLGWGGGPHICLGLHLAKMEAEVALSKIIARWPELKLGNEPVWSKRIGVRGLDKLPVKLN